MSSRARLFDLFDATSLLNLERRLAEGKIPTAEELAAVLEANSAEPLPAWFSALVVKSLRGELKKKRGRPKDENLLSSIYFQFAMAKYHLYLPRLQNREPSVGLDGFPALRRKPCCAAPPHH